MKLLTFVGKGNRLLPGFKNGRRAESSSLGTGAGTFPERLRRSARRIIERKKSKFPLKSFRGKGTGPFVTQGLWGGGLRGGKEEGRLDFEKTNVA